MSWNLGNVPSAIMNIGTGRPEMPQDHHTSDTPDPNHLSPHPVPWMFCAGCGRVKFGNVCRLCGVSEIPEEETSDERATDMRKL